MQNRLVSLAINCSVSISIFCIINSSFAWAQTEHPTSNTNALRGSLTLDIKNQTAPLDPVLWPGNYFDKEVATALLKDETHISNIWKKIPTWQAGEWKTTQATNTKSLIYKSGFPYGTVIGGVYTSKGEETEGKQKDKNGEIWEQYGSNYWTETDHGDTKAMSYVTLDLPGAYDYPDSYTESVVFTLDKASNKITAVCQKRCWSKLINVAPGIMKEEEVHTAFDESGKPTVSAWNTSIMKRTHLFSEYDGKLVDDKELQRDFVSYLINNGLRDVIPPGAKSNKAFVTADTNDEVTQEQLDEAEALPEPSAGPTPKSKSASIKDEEVTPELLRQLESLVSEPAPYAEHTKPAATGRTANGVMPPGKNSKVISSSLNHTQ
jgi:hypothetical protein